MKIFRMLENGEEAWRGKAYDVEHAEEKAFENESPGSLMKYTLQVWTGKDWENVYTNQNLAFN